MAAAVANVDAGFVVDGDLSDWGVLNAGNYSHSRSGWTVGAPINTPYETGLMYGKGTKTHDGFTFDWIREDSNDSWDSDAGYLGPNWGGQNYDSEFLAAGVFGNELRVAIVTGQRRDNGFKRFAPGDLRIEMFDNTNQGVIFGVEIGGGEGGTGGSSVAKGARGSTYTLDSHGYTIGHTASGLGVNDHVAGSVWRTEKDDWILDPIPGGIGDPIWENPGLDPVQLQFTGGTRTGDASAYIYRFGATGTTNKTSSSLGQKAVIEMSIPLSALGNFTFRSVTWAPSCGNDILHLPEPATFGMMLLGSIGFAGLRRLRRSEVGTV